MALKPSKDLDLPLARAYLHNWIWLFISYNKQSDESITSITIYVGTKVLVGH